MYRMNKKTEAVTVNPDLQIIRTVTKGDFVVDAKYVKEIGTFLKLIEEAGLQYYGDGIHSLIIKINGVQIGYQLVSTGPGH